MLWNTAAGRTWGIPPRIVGPPTHPPSVIRLPLDCVGHSKCALTASRGPGTCAGGARFWRSLAELDKIDCRMDKIDCKKNGRLNLCLKNM